MRPGPLPCLLALGLVWAGSDPVWAEGDPAQWLHGELRVGVGLDYSEGDYGEDSKTRLVYAPLSLAYLFDDFVPTPTRRDQLELRIIVPVLYVDGVLTAGVDDDTTAEGLGDILVSALYLYYPAHPSLPAVELGFHSKIPTASESDGLGTGEVDYGLELTLFQQFGSFVPFASGGYRFVGENEPDYRLRDGAVASAGVAWAPHPGWSLGGSYDWRQSISKRSTTAGGLVRADDSHELTFFGAVPLGKRLRLAPYVVAGLAQGSPDYAVGLQLQLVAPFRP